MGLHQSATMTKLMEPRILCPPIRASTMSAPPRPPDSEAGTVAPRFHDEHGRVSRDRISTHNRLPTTLPVPSS